MAHKEGIAPPTAALDAGQCYQRKASSRVDATSAKPVAECLLYWLCAGSPSESPPQSSAVTSGCHSFLFHTMNLDKLEEFECIQLSLRLVMPNIRLWKRWGRFTVSPVERPARGHLFERPNGCQNPPCPLNDLTVVAGEEGTGLRLARVLVSRFMKARQDGGDALGAPRSEVGKLLSQFYLTGWSMPVKVRHDTSRGKIRHSQRVVGRVCGFDFLLGTAGLGIMAPVVSRLSDRSKNVFPAETSNLGDLVDPDAEEPENDDL
ncbi:hypothetical protein B0H14DRAFT_2590816 [Mycena olivaceomarginata]|nr:hypothetical protein B0H14DRAFT_2590816 [Mycena olivaceomarginata]